MALDASIRTSAYWGAAGRLLAPDLTPSVRASGAEKLEAPESELRESHSPPCSTVAVQAIELDWSRFRILTFWVCKFRLPTLDRKYTPLRLNWRYGPPVVANAFTIRSTLLPSQLKRMMSLW